MAEPGDLTALVVRAQAGDRDAFSRLAQLVAQRLYTTASFIVGDEDVANDAVQEALVLGWRDIRGLRDPSRFVSWIQRVLVRCATHEAQRERRHHPAGIDVINTIADTADAYRAVDARDEVDRALHELKPDQRAVLALKFVLGYSDDETSEILGLPLGTVKSRSHRAAAELRAVLEAQGRRSPWGAREVSGEP
jgi:RNA polymerase sigma-70 factor (ECF subfamily)